MTSLRFPWQVQVAQMVPGYVLNVGSAFDPAGMRDAIGSRCLNCDLLAKQGEKDNNVDIVMDCTQEPWPFNDSFAGLVVFGDILEHLFEEGQEIALREARRVASYVAITVPNDPRFLGDDYPDANEPTPLRHNFHVTEEHLRSILERTGWKVIQWHTVDYVFVPEGYFVLAERA